MENLAKAGDPSGEERGCRPPWERWSWPGHRMTVPAPLPALFPLQGTLTFSKELPKSLAGGLLPSPLAVAAGEGSRRDPGSLISTLVLPPATSLCPPRIMPQPRSSRAHGQHLGASLAFGPDSILFTSTHRPRGTKGGKGCPVQAHPRLAFRKTLLDLKAVPSHQTPPLHNSGGVVTFPSPTPCAFRIVSPSSTDPGEGRAPLAFPSTSTLSA
ncbi:hypothetical protein Celaphus_00011398 [Cervus elaphus hippelaphus]|uniref:Uncharacterized protein n=1 Tax=Cervus elaphus hippelaphus TaxID=46360 RepID=A0A212DFR4_CEREH|nr:hypothetical protein Celaphus_00011398 [Cervus elaphus hippelaphus]